MDRFLVKNGAKKLRKGDDFKPMDSQPSTSEIETMSDDEIPEHALNASPKYALTSLHRGGLGYVTDFLVCREYNEHGGEHTLRDTGSPWSKAGKIAGDIGAESRKMKEFDNTALGDWLSESVSEMHVTEVKPVQRWMRDLRMMTECECMCILQGKPIRSSTSDLAKITISTKDNIYALRKRAKALSADFAKLYYQLESSQWKDTHLLSLELSIQIRTLLRDCTMFIPNMPLYLFQQQQIVIEECTKLVKQAEIFDVRNGSMPSDSTLIHILRDLGKAFTHMVNMVQATLIKALVRSIEQAASEYSIKTAVSAVHTLSQDGNDFCKLLAQEGGIQALLQMCRQSALNSIKPMALRTVAHLCNTTEGRQELEKASGIEYLSEILSSPTSTESVKAEAASVIAHITSPNIDNYHHLLGFIEHMEDLLRELTGVCDGASNSSIFLVSASAIANITFMDSMACECLATYDTAQVLIRGCYANKADTMYCKDQVATILANMAITEQCRQQIFKAEGIQLLVDFLQVRSPYLNDTSRSSSSCSSSSSSKQNHHGNRRKNGCHSNKEDREQVAVACERVQQKAAIALARLSRDQKSAITIMELQGIPRLVELCNNRWERNDSEPVLVACLAALRKLHGILGQSAFEATDLQDLIKPRLIDSFLLCSATKESFV